MGYQSVTYVPRISTYKHARKIYDEAVPIRGRSTEMRPLGRRKDASTYWCRMEDGNVELMLYHTAVLTFKPDGDIVVQTNGYSTISTHEFISQVMGALCNGVRGNTVLSIRDGTTDKWVRHIVPKNESLTLRMVDGRITVPDPKGNYEYRLDRKATKNLRIRYKDFYTYVDSMIKIRAVEQQPRYPKYRRYAEEKLPPVVEFDPKEFADMLGFEAHLVTGQKRLKRTFVDIYKRRAELDFYISGEQPAEVRNDNFYTAFLGMALSEADYGWEDGKMNAFLGKSSTEPRIVRVNVIRERIDEQILRAHADEVLVWTRLAPDALPNGKYKHWLEDK